MVFRSLSFISCVAVWQNDRVEIIANDQVRICIFLVVLSISYLLNVWIPMDLSVPLFIISH